MKTLVIIPAYEEEVAIGSIVLRARRQADEVLVVDDGSTDRTAEVARLAGAMVIRHDRNLGKGAALRTGLTYARKKGAGAVVLLDGDGQHDPDGIREVLAPVLADQADLVCGLRYGTSTGMPFYRRVGKRVLDYATAVPAKGLVTDSQCGFRALSRTAIDTLALTEDGFAVESEMLVEAKEKDLRISEVPVTVRYDVEGSTKGAMAHGFGVIDKILRIIAVRHPLLFFGVPGLSLLIAGFLLGLVTLEIYNRTRNFAIGYALLVVVFLLMGSLAMFAGILLNVMPRVLNRILNADSKSAKYE